MNKIIISIFALNLLISTANAEDAIIRDVEPKEENRIEAVERNIIAPSDMIKIYSTKNQEIQYMLDNYSDADLIKYAKMINKMDRSQAVMDGRRLPPKLSKETLKDREKIGDYLRSFYTPRYR